MLSSLSRVASSPARCVLEQASRQTPKVTALTGAVRALSSTPPAQKDVTLLQDKKSGFGFARSNPRPPKPRTKGVTEIRGPYYTVMGKRYLTDVLETMGTHVDGLKFAGGSFSLFQEKPLRELIDLAHEHGVYVSTGGWAEHLLTHSDANAVFDKYLRKCKDLGFDVIELSSGFLSFPEDDWLRLVDKVHSYKLKAKPELGIQFGAGGDTPASGLEAIGTSDPAKLVNLGRKFLDAGVERLMIESEGITENVQSWRTDVVSTIMKELPSERVMFEAADPKVYNWYIREFGIDVNLFVDHSQIVQLSCLRHGIWGTADTWGKIVSFRPEVFPTRGPYAIIVCFVMPKANTAPGARLRCRRACDSCKRRKQKCNGEQPCTICIQRRKESECHFSDKPARLLKPTNSSKDTMLLSERIVPTPQRQTAMDRLLNSLEDRSANLEQQGADDKDGMAPVPKVARLLRDGEGKFMYVGDSASLSFLQSVRRIVSSSIGRCEFTEDNSRHSMLEAFQNGPTAQKGPLISPPSNEEAQRLARQFVLATSPLLDLFDLNEFHPRLADWVENPTGDEDTVSSIFYLVLAIGAQVSDINQTLAEQYFVSGRRLAFSAFTETPSIHTIQSYVLISMYMLGACRRNGAFMNLGIALRAAYAVGIHRKDANALFCARERRARERVWKSLRMMDLYLSASLGRPPATLDFDYELREDSNSAEEQQRLNPEEQLSMTVISLCHIFERILTEVYMRQVVSINVAEAISNQHRAWVRSLPMFLQVQTERLDSKTLEGTLSAAHIFGSYYWSIILLTRPFLIFRVSQYVRNRTEATGSADSRASNSRIALFADACVYSALRGLNIVDDLCRYTTLPRRLPFLINSVFNSAVVLGAAFFADYDNLLPLEEGMDKAEKFLGLFVPHDPHACRFFQIIKYLRGAVAEYVRRRNRQWMERRSRQVDQLFGQVGPSNEPPAAETNTPTSHRGDQAAVPSPLSSDKLSGASISQPPDLSTSTTTGPTDGDIWDTLCGAQGAGNLPFDTAISTLTTTGIPIGCSAGGTIPIGGIPPEAPSAQTPLSDVILPDNGLLYMAEDLPVFGIWEDA
ncbi:coma-domain-containing protein [Aspergillus sclerotioniger CBS 115572]|uniref:Coma-domain-containing protein n=1 Tax=Aspergillus sclerotioniger CBS 115572 TaxID=1450535 RepID=A0A317VDV4_9EURO|nr:coma-domain-containing protein [Aspergillus sclerotioniger CBS 115572]PWY72476.1 coma-domain-containing protein [Aspergillus sclerotioniger CBS 115572]